MNYFSWKPILFTALGLTICGTEFSHSQNLTLAEGVDPRSVHAELEYGGRNSTPLPEMLRSGAIHVSGDTFDITQPYIFRTVRP